MQRLNAARRVSAVVVEQNTSWQHHGSKLELPSLRTYAVRHYIPPLHPQRHVVRTSFSSFSYSPPHLQPIHTCSSNSTRASAPTLPGTPICSHLVNSKSCHVCSSVAPWCTVPLPLLPLIPPPPCGRLLCHPLSVSSSTTTPSTPLLQVPITPFRLLLPIQQPLKHNHSLVSFIIALFGAQGFGNSAFAIYVAHDLATTAYNEYRVHQCSYCR